MARGDKRFTLYWTSLDTYEKCPQRFLWTRGWGAIDTGGGPGRPRPKPYKDSRHHALMGIVLAAVIEDFYNNEEWKHPQGLKARLEDLAAKRFSLELANNYVDWRLAPSREEMLRICTEGAINFVRRTLKEHKFLGPYARSEVNLLGFIDKWNPIGGRADIVFRRPDTGTTILDGKNSKEHWDKKANVPMYYTDPDQLRWYALCFYYAYRQMPDRLGFVYFRYPTGYTWEAEAERYAREAKDASKATAAWKKKAAEFYANREPAKGVSWVDFTREDLKGLAQRAKDVRRGMEKEQFGAAPSPSNCRFCDYESVCEERQAQKHANKSKRRGKKADPTLDNANGMIQFTFGGGGGSKLRDSG